MSDGKNQISKKELFEALRKYDGPTRRVVMKLLLNSKEYQDDLKKGLPFFTDEELQGIEERYKEGMTWKEIEGELFKKGMILKRATFRKWVQQGLIPSTKGYNVSSKGRVAKYPPETVRHINFYKYLQFNKNLFWTELMDKLSKSEISALEEVESYLNGVPFYASICDFIGIGNPDFPSGLDEALSDCPDILNPAKKMLDEIVADFNNIIVPKIETLQTFLESHKVVPVFGWVLSNNPKRTEENDA